jgi:hypothetical protein
MFVPLLPNGVFVTTKAGMKRYRSLSELYVAVLREHIEECGFARTKRLTERIVEDWRLSYGVGATIRPPADLGEREA